MRKNKILWLIALYLIIPRGMINAEETKPKPKKQTNQLVPLLLPVASSDIGVGLAGIGIYTWNGHGNIPYRSQLVVAAARTTLGLEALNAKLDTPNVAGTKFRLGLSLALLGSKNSLWYGYGNQANSKYIQQVEKGEIPGPGNFQRKPDILQGQEASLNEDYLRNQSTGLNPGRRYLQESQNKFYKFISKSRGGSITLERQLGQTPFKLKGGTTFTEVRIDSYQGDREENNTIPNRATLLDLEQPVGYDATMGPRMVSTFLLQLIYDTVSPNREANPDRGLRIGIQSESATQTLGSDYNFQRYTGFIYGYMPLFDNYFKDKSRELILALRLQGNQTLGDVPFFYERGLGGRTLRGFSGNRFRDRIVVFWGAELRYTLATIKTKNSSTNVYTLAFFDQGRTAASQDDLSAKDFHTAGGMGIGAIAGKNTVIEFVLGVSRHESYFELSVGHTFKAY